MQLHRQSLVLRLLYITLAVHSRWLSKGSNAATGEIHIELEVSALYELTNAKKSPLAASLAKKATRHTTQRLVRLLRPLRRVYQGILSRLNLRLTYDV